jgi:hypothetical protein
MPTVAIYGVARAQLNTKTTKLGVAGRGDEDVLRLDRRPFYRKRPLLVGFKKQTRAQKTRDQVPHLWGPRLLLKTH